MKARNTVANRVWSHECSGYAARTNASMLGYIMYINIIRLNIFFNFEGEEKK